MAFKRKWYKGKSRIGRYSKYSKRASSKIVAAARRRAMIRTIRAVTMRQSEPKHFDYTTGKVELYHNTIHYIHVNAPSGMPSQGTADTMRVGDQINTIGFSIRMLFGQKTDRPNVSFRWMFVRVPKNTAYSYGTWFNQITTNVLLDDVNTDMVTVIKSGLWRPNEAGLGATGGDEYTFAKKIWLPHKYLYKFGPASGTTAHNLDDFHFIIAPYDAFGSLLSDNIAYVQYVQTLHFRDP